MQDKFYNLKGLNTRSSDLIREGQYSSDLINVRRNSRGDITERPSTKNLSDGFGGLGLFTYVPSSQLLNVENTLKYWDSLLGWVEAENTQSKVLDVTDYYRGINVKDSFYFLNDEEVMLKYDGKGFYRAGMPKGLLKFIISATASATGTANKDFDFMFDFFSIDRNFYSVEGRPTIEPEDYHTVVYQRTISTGVDAYFDVEFIGPHLTYDELVTGKWLQNTAYLTGDKVLAPDNKIYTCSGDHTSSTGGTALADFLSDSASWSTFHDGSFDDNTNLIGFEAKWAIVDGLQQSVDEVTVLAGHNLVAGDVVYIEMSPSVIVTPEVGEPFDNYVKVLSVTATTIKLDINYISVAYFADGFILTNKLINIYIRNFTDGGEFYLAKTAPINPSILINSTTVYVDTDPIGELPVYAQLRGVPPKGTGLVFHQDQIFVITADHEVSYSDILNWEVFPIGDNVLTVAQNEDGILKALASVDDYIFFLKSKEIYFGNGSFGTNQNIRIWPSGSFGAGCIAPRSVQVIGNTVVYLSEKGFYSVSGGTLPSELSELISPIIRQGILPDESEVDLDLENAISCIDEKNDSYICFVPGDDIDDSLIFVYDFYYKDWFIWQGFRADGGLIIHNDLLYGQALDLDKNVFVEDPATNLEDSGVAFEAEYATHWHNLGEAGIEKKFIRAKIFSLTNTANEFSVASQLDWMDYDENEATLTFTGKALKSKNVGIDKLKGQSFRLKFKSVAGKKMVITGLELEVDPAFKRMKKQ